MIDKHFNHKWSGATPDNTGDRFYTQDLGMDFQFLQQLSGLIAKDMASGVTKFIARGLRVTQGAGNSLNITQGAGYCLGHSAKIPVDAVLPPNGTIYDIEAMRCEIIADLVNTTGTSWNPTYGATKNYVKIQYYEPYDSLTRTKAKAGGLYNPWVDVSYQIIVDATPPTDYQICLCSFIGPSGGPYVFTDDGDVRLGSQTFLRDGVYQKITGIDYVRVIMSGPGGNGGKGGWSGTQGGGGGGGSGEILDFIFPLNDDLVITIGQAGVSDTTMNRASGGTFYTAKKGIDGQSGHIAGGSGGLGGNGGGGGGGGEAISGGSGATAGAGFVTYQRNYPPFNGGVGGLGGVARYGGQGGQYAFAGGNGQESTNTNAGGGGGAVGLGGPGGDGGAGNSGGVGVNGADGTLYGCGGGGGGNGSSQANAGQGGAGGPGVVIIIPIKN